MTFNEIASVAGKGGLFKVLKPARAGVIVESMDAKRKKLVLNANARVSVLAEISIYTTDADGAVPLPDIYYKIFEEFGEDPGIEGNADADELKAFMRHVLPDYDDERVYPNDMKKLVAWYHLLLRECPEVLQRPAEEETEGEAASADASAAVSEDAGTAEEAPAAESQEAPAQAKGGKEAKA